MTPRLQPVGTAATPARARIRPLLGALFLLLFAWASAAPARADIIVDGTNSSSANPYVINGDFTGSVFVESGGFLNVETGANISGSFDGIDVEGGTVNVSGGMISGPGRIGLVVFPQGGTVNVSGGTISGHDTGVHVEAGTVSLSGGMISGGSYGVIVQGGNVNLSGSTISGPIFGVADEGGTTSITGGSISGGTYGIEANGSGTLGIYGCSLQFSGGQLIGTLQDGTAISTPVNVLVSLCNLVDTCSGDLPISMSTLPSPSVPTGSNLTYTITVGYAGSGAAQNVTLTDTLPAGTSFVSASAPAGTLTTPKRGSNTLTWKIAALPSGQSIAISVQVKVMAKPGNILTHTASVSSTCPQASNSKTVMTSVVSKR